MRCIVPQITWHSRDPVHSVDFDPSCKGKEGYYRLASAGGDSMVLIWRLKEASTFKPEIHCVAELTRHNKTVNVVRFSPDGKMLASGDDDAYILLWRNESVTATEETWTMEKTLRKHYEDIADLCWSSDGNFLVSGSVDNAAVVWDINKVTNTSSALYSLGDHTSFVHGVCFDPLNEFIATMSVDRSLRFFNPKNGKLVQRVMKYPPSWVKGSSEESDEVETNKENTGNCSKSKNKMEVDSEGDKTKSTSVSPSSQSSTQQGRKSREIGPPVLVVEIVSDCLQNKATAATLEVDEPMDIDNACDTAESCNPVAFPMLKSETNDARKQTVEGEKTTPTKQTVTSVSPSTSIKVQEAGDSTVVATDATRLVKPEGEECVPKKTIPQPPMVRLFHDDTLKTFNRRLAYSPGGEILVVPSGILPSAPVTKDEKEKDGVSKGKTKGRKHTDKESGENHAVVIFCRNSLLAPCALIPTGASYAVAARFCPIYFERKRKLFQYDDEFANPLKKSERSIACVGKLRPPPKKSDHVLIDMPQRLVYAVVTNDSVLLCDTVSPEPMAVIKNIHYARITDATWSSDGRLLIVSSTDGYCSVISFEDGELGTAIPSDQVIQAQPNCYLIPPTLPKMVKLKTPKAQKASVSESEPVSEKTTKQKTPKARKVKVVSEEPTTEESIPILSPIKVKLTPFQRMAQFKCKVKNDDSPNLEIGVSESQSPVSSSVKAPRRIQLITLPENPTNSTESPKSKEGAVEGTNEQKEPDSEGAPPAKIIKLTPFERMALYKSKAKKLEPTTATIVKPEPIVIQIDDDSQDRDSVSKDQKIAFNPNPSHNSTVISKVTDNSDVKVDSVNSKPMSASDEKEPIITGTVVNESKSSQSTEPNTTEMKSCSSDLSKTNNDPGAKQPRRIQLITLSSKVASSPSNH